jgi:hypothetical protein
MASLYLDYPEAAFTPVHMSPKAKFELSLINQLDPTKTITKGQPPAQHGGRSASAAGWPAARAIPRTQAPWPHPPPLARAA